MLKTVIALYSSMMVILSFILLTLLIAMDLKDISDYKSIEQNITFNKNSEILNIRTDKSIYNSGEKVLILFENMLPNRMIQKEKSDILVKTRKNMGKNFEVAFIEKKEGDEWIAIEPVTRCETNCSKSCLGKIDIEASEREVFIWQQTMFNCNEEGENSIESVGQGEFRISSAAWDSRKNENIKVSSNTFRISNLSRK